MSRRTRLVLSLLAGLVLALSLLYGVAEQRCSAEGAAFALDRMACVPLASPPIILERDLRRS